ncbi:MAG: phosphoribosylamine--glycine ligase [Elusimicrobia bacterium RIFOXYD2_FULL_34_15]|nr:MAG: phosphoribosylamine--glycine ligase [Elusimicrobia bacterium RIFOXYD2_FULL_34_15]
MNILVIGSGGREHAIVWKLSKSNKIKKIFCIPGSGAISKIAECVNIDSLDFEKISDFVLENKIDLTVVGPEIPLSEGIVDYFNKKNLKIFGPDKRAAQLESSKVFAKTFMKKYNIPTASFEVFDNYEKALKYINSNPSVVIKADGLAAGKGVFVCDNVKEAQDALKEIMVNKIFGEAGKNIVIEEKLSGEETSLLAFCDGKTILPLIPAQDHKRIFDFDKGPNTGGMGAYAPVNLVDKKASDKIFDSFLNGINLEKLNFKGIIYVGIMLTKEGPKVLEFNVRFGDPETQAILPLLKTDLLDLVSATVNGELSKYKIEWYNGYCVSVVLASGGYPGKFEKGKEISGLDNIKDAVVFHAGTKLENGKFLTSGGRVLNISAIGPTLKESISKVYSNLEKIKFEGMHYRKDIAAKRLSQ